MRVGANWFKKQLAFCSERTSSFLSFCAVCYSLASVPLCWISCVNEQIIIRPSGRARYVRPMLPIQVVKMILNAIHFFATFIRILVVGQRCVCALFRVPFGFSLEWSVDIRLFWTHITYAYARRLLIRWFYLFLSLSLPFSSSHVLAQCWRGGDASSFFHRHTIRSIRSAFITNFLLVFLVYVNMCEYTHSELVDVVLSFSFSQLAMQKWKCSRRPLHANPRTCACTDVRSIVRASKLLPSFGRWADVLRRPSPAYPFAVGVARRFANDNWANWISNIA